MIKMNNHLTAALVSIALLPFVTQAHHATGPRYDRSQIVEADGEVTEVLWRNPHVRFTVESTDANGVAKSWDIETNSVSIVSRFGLRAGMVEPGSRVRIAGNPGHADEGIMWLTNMLLPSDEEILFGARVEPRWSDRTIGEDIRSSVAGDPRGELGIFRVWTNSVSPSAFWNGNYSLTDAARAARDAYDPITDDPTLNCAPKGMPYVMEQPYPVQFIDEGDEIVFRLEEYDTLRRFAMVPGAEPGPTAPRFGRSVGRWDGVTLVVETTGIDYPYFNGTGIPQGPESRIEEHFSLNDDGSRLEYTMIFSDPGSFTEPVALTKAWEWRPGEEVRPYECL